MAKHGIMNNVNGADSIPLLPPPPSKTKVAASRPESPSGNSESNVHSLGQVQNVKNARVYIFGESDNAEEHLHHQNSFQLRPRGKQKTTTNHHNYDHQDVIFLEREIKDGDSLEKFALQYGCTVIELKQANKIVNSQEFFALRTIKIPVKKYGLLTESDEERKRRGFSESEVTSPTDSYHSINGESDDSDVLYRTLSIGMSLDDCKEGKDFLKVMDKDLKKIARSTKTSKKSLEEVASVLNGKCIHPMQFPKRQTESHWSTQKIVLLIAGIVLVSTLVVVLFLTGMSSEFWT